MFSEEKLLESRESASKAKVIFERKKTIPTGISGAESAAHTAVTRTAMRKNQSNISKTFLIDPIFNILQKLEIKTFGVIPHPIAWDILEDEETIYAHTIDGRDVECVYEKTGKNSYLVHRLSVDDRTIIDEDTEIL